MRRTALRSKAAREWRKPERATLRVPAVPSERRAVMVAANDMPMVQAPKDRRAMQSGADADRLWKHIRTLPCARCWQEGKTQVSHSNQLIDGKGRGLKAYPWRVAALCVDCHSMIDQGKDMNKEERRQAWESAHRWTVGELFARGLVRPV